MTSPVESRRGRLLLGALVVSHLLIISGQVEAGGNRSLLVQVVFGALAPLRRVVSGSYYGTREVLRSYVALRGVREENRRLGDRLRVVEIELNTRRQHIEEVERLRALLDLQKRIPFETLAAELVAAEGLPWASVITVNRGSLHGVSLNTPAISRSGVIGRVIAVGPHAAKIQLIIDRDSGVGVIIERSRTTGVLEGTAASWSELPMRFVPAVADARVGDAVVTSGLDQIYPKGLFVGYVSRVTSGDGLLKEVFVAPASRFDRLEEVLLLRVPPNSYETPESLR